MILESWSHFVLSLSRPLLALPINISRGNVITHCLQKRSELMDFINQMRVLRDEKSADLARDFMKEGDNKFQAKCYHESLKLYSKSILYTPNNSPDLSLAYIKRSLVLLYCDYQRNAMCDIEMALQSGFTRRKSLETAFHFLQIGDNKSAVTVLHEVLIELNISLTEHYVGKEFKIHKNAERYNFQLSSYIKTWNLPALKNGENPDFPYSSNSTQVVHNNEKGCHVVAKCDIKAGDVLFVEKAFAFTVTDSYCSGCGTATDVPIPCPGCVDITFCSKKCRDTACESYHKFECGFISLVKATGIGYLALRIILKASSNFEELKQIVGKFVRRKEFHKNNCVTFSKNAYENVYNLQTHMDSMYVEDLLQYSLTATMLALYLAHHTTYVSSTEENIIHLSQILLYHITQLISNASTLSHGRDGPSWENPVVGFERKKYGGGIYPSISMMNHSCESSIFHSAHGDTLIVRARRDINKGEEVFNNYGVDSKHMKRSERQELLKAAYFFDCNCSSCSQTYDPYDMLNALKCEECKGPLLPESELNVNRFLCLDCNTDRSLRREEFRRLNEIGKLIEDGKRKLYNERDMEGALRAFVDSWKLGRTILYKLHVDLYYSASLIAYCLYLLNDFKPCISFLKCVVRAAEGRYGGLDPMYRYQAEKLIHCVLLYYEDVIKIGSKVDVDEIKSMRELGLQYCDIVEDINKLYCEEGDPYASLIHEKKKMFQSMSSCIGSGESTSISRNASLQE